MRDSLENLDPDFAFLRGGDLDVFDDERLGYLFSVSPAFYACNHLPQTIRAK